jgi:DNA-3-methyladenine glycosylase
MLQDFTRLNPIPRSFYMRETVDVARDLLGSFLVRTFGQRKAVLRITEVEAYRGTDDPASHAYRGNRGRASIMFGETGIAYVYLSYGINYCLNVTARSASQDAGAVLIRAAEPIFGLDLLGREGSQCKVASGPGNLTRALKVDMSFNGLDLTLNGPLYISRGYLKQYENISSGPRIGISRGREKQWRFFISGNCSVSKR